MMDNPKKGDGAPGSPGYDLGRPEDVNETTGQGDSHPEMEGALGQAPGNPQMQAPE